MTVYEDGTVLAFADHAPLAPGHLLIVPREHHRDLLETPDALLAHLMRVARHVAQAQVRALSADGLTVVQSNGHAGGQRVFHIHIHLIPRKKGVPVFEPRTAPLQMTGDALEAACAPIRAALATARADAGT